MNAQKIPICSEFLISEQENHRKHFYLEKNLLVSERADPQGEMYIAKDQRILLHKNNGYPLYIFLSKFLLLNMGGFSPHRANLFPKEIYGKNKKLFIVR